VGSISLVTAVEAVRKAFWSQVALMSCFALASHARSQEEIFSFKWASLAEQVAQEANGNPTMGNGFSGLFVQPLVLVCGAKWIRWPEKPIEAQQLLV